MRFLQALKYAWQGIRDSYRTEPNFRIHSGMGLLAVLMGFVLRIEVTEWLWIALSISLVLAAELFNTALESLVDLSSPGYRPLAKKAKDAAAAAVLIAAVFSLICGLIIFLPKLASWIN